MMDYLISFSFCPNSTNICAFTCVLLWYTGHSLKSLNLEASRAHLHFNEFAKKKKKMPLKQTQKTVCFGASAVAAFGSGGDRGVSEGGGWWMSPPWPDVVGNKSSALLLEPLINDASASETHMWAEAALCAHRVGHEDWNGPVITEYWCLLEYYKLITQR